MENQSKYGENVPVITSKYTEEESFIATKITNVKQQSDNICDSDNISFAKLRMKHIHPRSRLFEATKESSNETGDYNDDESIDPSLVLGKKMGTPLTLKLLSKEKKAKRMNKQKQLIQDHQSKDNTKN
ncbi:hypothetical protein DPMN_143193 [Dreissena polymorpha]|uniref:Uncharacterized protein n=1 Tax=Dreissena polymorpha TaxID=45954 RepID=A0A9D4JP40_DREPO|nr:hypothetical protein DPMN_143193 [Dreissena polymorpha]